MNNSPVSGTPQQTFLIGGDVQSYPIAVGCMRMAEVPFKQAEALVMTAVEHGITLFDHADIYGGGESESIFGKILKEHAGLRETILLQDKCGICKGYYDASKEHILRSVEQSLQRLGAEQLDFLLLHRPDTLMIPQEVAAAFETLQAQGKVRYFGVSNQNAQQIAMLRAVCPMPLVINQVQFGLAHTLLVDEGINVNIHEEHAVSYTGGLLEYCRQAGISLQAWSPFQVGMFEGVFFKSARYGTLNKALADMAQEKGVSSTALAFAWILRHPAAIQPVAGTMNADHLKDLCTAVDITLSREEWYRLYVAAGNPLP